MGQAATPELLVVVDTEEEFDWAAPFSREATATRSIPAQVRAHEIYDRFGIVPTYVVDYPVTRDSEAVRFLKGLKSAGKAEIGAHLHPWVTPPHVEPVNRRNSYHCNLPADLERAKLEILTSSIAAAFGERPTIFKAGRHGFGPSTAATLLELGYEVDCSQLPYTDLSAEDGPDFRGIPADPWWIADGLLEVPLTIGFFGAAAGFGPKLGGLFDSASAARLRLPGLLARSGLIARSRLTPEGVSAAEQCRLIDALVRRGQTCFTLVYHSPSLEPGHTPYVRSGADLEIFLQALEHVLAHFRDRVGGKFTTLSELRRNFPEDRKAA